MAVSCGSVSRKFVCSFSTRACVHAIAVVVRCVVISLSVTHCSLVEDFALIVRSRL